MQTSTLTSKIPVFILAGGLGTRITEETHIRPKPMIEIGEIPILVHIMRWYYAFGFNDFVICVGYRSWDIKEFFLNYEFRSNHLVIDHRESQSRASSSLGKSLEQEKWRVRVIDTGLQTMTGGRLARAYDEVQKAETFDHFALTYGDGLSDVDLVKQVDFHLTHRRLGTVLGVPPLARFGELDVTEDQRVEGFLEKPEARQSLINGGFFLFQSEFRRYLSVDVGCTLEREPLSKLASDGQLMVYGHKGFWHPMDTLRDRNHLQSIWDSGKAPWHPRAAP